MIPGVSGKRANAGIKYTPESFDISSRQIVSGIPTAAMDGME